ncbi:hypothetical protein ABZ920_17605 [Streptomyces sp. NPDC046831]|uniref:hypothetical protein n=1 Tax=Streptomyces sp. NPDC046831 TaxID=3154805 RepID=UPI003411ED87
MASWNRALGTSLAVCVLLSGPAACGPEGKEVRGGAPAPSAGRLLDSTDGSGRRYREVDARDAPRLAIEVQPDTAGGWDVRLTVHRFRFSPPGTAPRAVAGRGHALLLVDGHPAARLHGPRYHLSARLAHRGTHHVTARLHADDGTVWAVSGRPVEETADITLSQAAGAGPTSPSARASP